MGGQTGPEAKKFSVIGPNQPRTNEPTNHGNPLEYIHEILQAGEKFTFWLAGAFGEAHPPGSTHFVVCGPWAYVSYGHFAGGLEDPQFIELKRLRVI